ncbi:MAG: hypothetical protein QM786_15615 [Breznakibacter sp.]
MAQRTHIHSYTSKSILLAMGCFCWIMTHANWNPSLSNFPKSLYQSGPQNWAICQQSNNWMYFANSYGLLEFDGLHWTTYPASNYSNVRAIAIDKHGRIYGGAYNEFGYYDPTPTAHLNYRSVSESLPQNELTFGNVWRIYPLDESIIFQADYNIFKYHPQNGIENIRSDDKIICSTCIDGTVYVATTNGLFILSGNAFFMLPGTGELKNKQICGIVKDKHNRLVIATKSDGFYRYASNTLSKWATPIDGFVQRNAVFCITLHGHTLAVGTILRGVAILDTESNTVRYINSLSGLQNNTVLGMNFDRNGDLWLALDNGISFVSLTSPFTYLYGQINSQGAGYASAIYKDVFYIGTNQGLFHTNWPVIPAESPLLFTAIDNLRGQVWTLNEIDGTLFCGHDQGAFVIDGQKAKKISSDAGFWLFQKWGRSNLILAGNYTGFYLLRRNGPQWDIKKIKGFNESARLFEQDADGTVWMSHGLKGIYRFKFNDSLDSISSIQFFGKEQGLPENTNLSVLKLNGRIVFTTSQGLYRFDEATQRMAPFDDMNAILSGNVFYTKLSEAPNNPNEIWYIHGQHLVIKDIEKNREQRFNLENEMVYGFEHIKILDASTAIIGNENGFSYFDKNTVHSTKSRIANCIRKVFITMPNDSLIWGNSHIPSDTAALFTIPFKHNSLRIECNAHPFLSDPNTINFYKLEGFDKEWNPLPESGIKEYTHLREGKYQFILKTQNPTMHQTTLSTFHIEVLPPWYRSKAMYLGYLLFFASVVYAIYYLIGQRIKHNQHKIEADKNRQIEEQKASFLLEAHEKEKEIIQLRADKLQYELKGKSQELANTVMNLVRKNEILTEINLDLQKSCTTDSLEAARGRLRKLQIKIKENIEHDDDWAKFEENFDTIHDNFMKHLSERFPQLSKNEKKLCAYLRLNLVSKDIAPLLNISVRGVEISRYRLRKKMDLPRDVNLTDFLQHL